VVTERRLPPQPPPTGWRRIEAELRRLLPKELAEDAIDLFRAVHDEHNRRGSEVIRAEMAASRLVGQYEDEQRWKDRYGDALVRLGQFAQRMRRRTDSPETREEQPTASAILDYVADLVARTLPNPEAAPDPSAPGVGERAVSGTAQGSSTSLGEPERPGAGSSEVAS
jgi:hypothetical protein